MKEFVMGAKMALEDNFSRQIRSVKRATEGFRSSVVDTNEATGDMINKQRRAKSSIDKFGDQARQAENQLKENTEATSRWKRTLGGITGILASVGGGMAAWAGKKWLIDSNARMETYRATLTRVLGSQEKAVKQLEWAESFAANTPFQLDKIVEATTKLEAYGLQSKKVMGITGDMAAVMGKPMKQAVEAVADAQTGQLERLKEFGITKEMITEQANALGTNPVNNKGQITDMKAFNAALFSLMEKRYKGGMKMQMNTWKGMVSNAKDFMSRLGRQLGKPIFNELKEQLSGILEWTNKIQKNGKLDAWISTVHKKVASFGQTLKSIGQTAVTVGKAIYNNWSWLGPMVTGLVTAWASYYAITSTVAIATKAWTALQTAYNAVITAYHSIVMIASAATQGWTAAQTALNLAMEANPIGLVVVAIGALIGGLILAYKHSETFRNIVNGTFNAIKRTVLPAINAVKTDVLNAFKSIQSFLAPAMPYIKAIIVGTWGVIKADIVNTLLGIKTAVSMAWNWLKVTTRGVYNVIKGIIQVLWSTVTGIFRVGINILKGDWSAAWDAMLTTLKGIGGGIKSVFTGFKDIFYNSGKAVINSLVSGMKEMANKPKEIMTSTFKKARNLLPFSDAKEGPFSQLTKSGGAILGTLAKGVQSNAGKLHTALNKAFNKAPNFNINARAAAGRAGGNTTAVRPTSVNVDPGGGTTNNSKSVSTRTVIQNLIGSLTIEGAGDKDTGEMVDEIITELYNRLSDADEILANGEMEGLL